MEMQCEFCKNKKKYYNYTANEQNKKLLKECATGQKNYKNMIKG